MNCIYDFLYHIHWITWNVTSKKLSIQGNFGEILDIFGEPARLITIPGKPGNHPGPGDDIEAGQPEEHLPGPGHLGGHHPLPHRVLHLNLSLQRYPAPTSLVFFSNNKQLLLLYSSYACQIL